MVQKRWLEVHHKLQPWMKNKVQVTCWCKCNPRERVLPWTYRSGDQHLKSPCTQSNGLHKGIQGINDYSLLLILHIKTNAQTARVFCMKTNLTTALICSAYIDWKKEASSRNKSQSTANVIFFSYFNVNTATYNSFRNIHIRPGGERLVLQRTSEKRGNNNNYSGPFELIMIYGTF